jgi:hypothetical protein
MPGQLIPVGPFTGGLNTFSDPSTILNNELVVAKNVELDFDGSIKSRPPFTDEGYNLTLGATGNITLLGYFYESDGTAVLIGTNGLDNTYRFTGTAWVSLFGASGTGKFAATAMTQYDAKAWLVAPIGSANPGGYWVSGGTYGTFTAQSNMPKGDTILAHKDRLWVSYGSASTPTRLYYSNVLGDPVGLWVASPDFLDVGYGDGQSILQVIVYFNGLLIFRSRSIYSFSYSDDPAAGTLSQVVGGIGIASKESVVQYESYVYFLFDDRAYEFTNGRAAQLNIKVPFTSTDSVNIYLKSSVSEFNRRVIFSHYDTMYVFSLQTRTWTTWKSSVYGSIGKIVKRETEDFDAKAYTHSSTAATGVTRVAKLLAIADVITAVGENIECIIQTKNLDYNSSSIYKRLFWWGADISAKGTVTAIASPVSFSSQVTWGQLRLTTWGNLLNFTWGQPQTPQDTVETVRNTAGTSPGRKFLKFLKSLRFRQINFKIVINIDGTSDTSPMRIFSFTTFVNAKETVSKAIT